MKGVGMVLLGSLFDRLRITEVMEGLGEGPGSGMGSNEYSRKTKPDTRKWVGQNTHGKGSKS